MTAMFQRRLSLPVRSFFLLGPRGTGKTTWLRSVLKDARWYNLLHQREWSRLLNNSEVFRQEVEALPHGSWVVVDEVQRLPALLDEVHDSLSLHATRVRFALTGSSARKLRRQETNLLAGRALSCRFFPLTLIEMGTPPPIDDLLRFGGLPGIRSEDDFQLRGDLLQAYRDTYLAEEIRNEGLVRSLEGFSRFLEVAALMNGQVVNAATTARDTGIARSTVKGYFDVLVDTMVGMLLPAWKARARVKETAHPKFYFFDPGVARFLATDQRTTPLHGTERGPLLETWVLHELRAWMHDSRAGGELTYWRVQSGLEVHFVWRRGDRRVGVEVKASDRWRSAEGDGLRALHQTVGLERSCVVYLGERRLKDGEIDIFPLWDFVQELNRGAILPPE